ncbi:MAG: hypothetical protein CM1200mP39_25140 [Dehalococcoidia bacterium]|nr:MAG: hypothetical protein CM1200mP39_25140 [Dehalococcoidia bacterium]
MIWRYWIFMALWWPSMSLMGKVLARTNTGSTAESTDRRDTRSALQPAQRMVDNCTMMIGFKTYPHLICMILGTRFPR